MDCALSQVDIITAIVSQVQSKNTLASLAQVSHVVSEAALDKLWRVSDNLVPLARCMPQEYWEEIETYTESFPGSTRFNYESQLTLSDHPRTGDWLGPRFRSYAGRIKRLRTEVHRVNRKKWPVRTPFVNVPSNEEQLPSAEGDEPSNQPAAQGDEDAFITSSLHQEIFQAWELYSQNVMPLFSNLKSLQWRAIDGNDLLSINGLLVPSIVHLRITADSSSTMTLPGKPAPFGSDTLTSIVRKATTSCPSFCSLDLFVDRGVIQGFSGTSSDLALHGLRHFQSMFFPIAPSLIQTATTWLNLRTFRVTLSPDLAPFPRSSRLFPAVETLRLNGASAECLQSIWLTVQSHYVHTLELSPCHELLPSQLNGLLRSVVDHPSAKSLRNITLNRSFSPMARMSHPTSNQPEENMAMELIQPLILRLSDLESFTLGQESKYPYTFPSPAIRNMLQAWPHVKKIYITNNTPERISMEAFLDLARDRPLLTSVTGLEVDFMIDTSLPDVPDWEHSNLEQVVFKACGSSESTANRIALVHHLLTTFPHIPSRCIQGDGAMRMFAFRAIRARKAGTPWGLNDYQKALTGTGKAGGNLDEQGFTGYYTEDGKPVLCFAKAIYNPIVMTSDEVHDERKLHLSEGDIIAVTAKHQNGKWTGVLLDEQRYDPNKDSFWGDSDHVEII